MKAWKILIAVWLVCGAGVCYGTEATKKIELTSQGLACLQKLIFFNECSGKDDRLVTWRSDEDFPSLGIGHFIWYLKGKRGPYRESFPELVAFLKNNGEEVPLWLEGEAPWKDREEFQKDLQSERVISLRIFLQKTKALQTQFIVRRMENVLPKMLEAAHKEKREQVEKNFYAVAQTPTGMLALIDYVNFKGDGTSLSERLQGQGWGLLQALEEMTLPEKENEVLPAFVHAAERILEKRVKSPFAQKDESRSLKGWANRVHNYLNITCSFEI